MIKTPKAKEYGKVLQTKAVCYFTKNAKLYKPTEDDYYKDIGMIASDVADLYTMGGFMIAGDFDSAADIGSGLDTVVREEVPNYIWTYLNKFVD
jgi:hypothetical protein